ncbi:MAG: hypothetical protein RBS39_01865 [Phycisphaerales bacterium]|jgi:hypothetical protein|nr:hypothetical protein [Phycisphaerales bacterium]
MPSPTREPAPFEPLAGILALALPGAGHAFLGDLRRGVHIGAGVLGLFIAGLLVGGIDVVDSKEDRLWFAGQALVGPIALGVDYVHQSQFKVPDAARPGQKRSPSPDENPKIHKSIGRMNELGMLFCTVAGMLNLIAVLDAAFPGPHVRRRA